MKSTLERLEKEKLVQDRAQVYEQRIHHQQYQQLKWAVEVTFLICFRMRGVPRKGGGSLRKEGGGGGAVSMLLYVIVFSFIPRKRCEVLLYGW